MEDPELVAVLHAVENLEEDLDRGETVESENQQGKRVVGREHDGSHLADQRSVAYVSLGLGDHSEEVSVGKELEDNVDDGGSFDDSVEGNDGRVRGSESMEGEFASLKVSLTSVESYVVQALDG